MIDNDPSLRAADMCLRPIPAYSVVDDACVCKKISYPPGARILAETQIMASPE